MDACEERDGHSATLDAIFLPFSITFILNKKVIQKIQEIRITLSNTNGKGFICKRSSKGNSFACTVLGLHFFNKGKIIDQCISITLDNFHTGFSLCLIRFIISSGDHSLGSLLACCSKPGNYSVFRVIQIFV